jgi:hypothetical protein
MSRPVDRQLVEEDSDLLEGFPKSARLLPCIRNWSICRFVVVNFRAVDDGGMGVPSGMGLCASVTGFSA